MDRKEVRRNAYDIIYLTACAVNGDIPDMKKIEGYDLEQMYKVCQRHILTAVTSYALESAGISDERFTQAKGKAIRKNILLDTERGKLLDRLEQEKIWYMPLKGSLLKDMYSKTGMRQMADNDILFDSAYRDRVRDIMLESGFSCENYGKGNHDVYFKKPVCNFEMHVSLFAESNVMFYGYYKDVKERLITDEDKSCGYHFSPEDFYIYLISHEYKHFSGGGTGIRSLLDTYMYLKRLKDTLDWNYINREAETLGLTDFERSNRELALKVFGREELTEEDRKLLDYHIFSGTYGNIDNSVRHKLDKQYDETGKRSKLVYIIRRIFPDMEFMTRAVPFVNNNPLLYPAGVIVRLVRGSTIRRKKLRREFNALKKIDCDEE